MKPYHLMTPEERVAARIASNRAIDAKVAVKSVKARAVAAKKVDREVGKALAGLANDLEAAGGKELAEGLVAIAAKHGVHLKRRKDNLIK